MKTDKPLAVRSEESIPCNNGTDLCRGPLGWFPIEAASARVAHVLANALFFDHESDMMPLFPRLHRRGPIEAGDSTSLTAGGEAFLLRASVAHARRAAPGRRVDASLPFCEWAIPDTEYSRNPPPVPWCHGPQNKKAAKSLRFCGFPQP